MWLYGRPDHTQRSYRATATRLLADCRCTLLELTLSLLVDWAQKLNGKPSTRLQRLASIKSLLRFGHETGYLPVNLGRALRLPKAPSHLSSRILTEAQVQKALALETDPRNRALLLLLYAGGLRVAELCALQVGDLHEWRDTGSLTVLGKGDQVRTILLPVSVWLTLRALAEQRDREAPLFPSRTGKPLDPTRTRRIVLAATQRAGIPGRVSPHWLRHAHASHALDRGCPLPLVRDTLGHRCVSTTSRYLHARPDDSSANYLAV